MSDSPRVAVLMGSKSDWPCMVKSRDTLAELGIPCEVKVISAHRNPPGMVASHTTVPVLGVPVESRVLRGVDSLLSIVQMPKGIPVGSLAVGSHGAINAAILAAQILGVGDEGIAKRVADHRDQQRAALSEDPEA